MADPGIWIIIGVGAALAIIGIGVATVRLSRSFTKTIDQLPEDRDLF